MPRGHSRNIEDYVKDAIVKVKKDNRDFSANQIRNHLLREHDKYGLKQEEIPQKRSIQKIIADNISNLRDMWASPQERPWTLGSLEHFPLSPDSLAMLLKMQIYWLEQRLTPMSRREAIWVSRLYPTILTLNEGKEPPNITWWLHWWVHEYSTMEQMYQIKHGNLKDFETFELDLDLFQSKGEPEKSKMLVLTPIYLTQSKDAQRDYENYLNACIKFLPSFKVPVLKVKTAEEKKRMMEAINKAADEIIEVKPEEVQK